jgi:hypothetical protein
MDDVLPFVGPDFVVHEVRIDVAERAAAPIAVDLNRSRRETLVASFDMSGECSAERL